MAEAATPFPRQPESSIAALLTERRNHVAAIKAIDAKLFEAWLQAMNALEEASAALAETDLKPGVKEEARQLCDELPERVMRAGRAGEAK